MGHTERAAIERSRQAVPGRLVTMHECLCEPSRALLQWRVEPEHHQSAVGRACVHRADYLRQSDHAAAVGTPSAVGHPRIMFVSASSMKSAGERPERRATPSIS
jgi:hypothetical protein